jgi:hypothetical protein
MAKGDDQRARNQIDQQGGLAQNHLNNMRTDMIVPQAQAAQNNHTRATEQAFKDYGDIMGGYDEFAKTGGYSPMDISNMRARGVSPMRAVYANANREVDRSRSLQGGYSPGYGTLKARMAREMSSGLSDASTNVEANLAQMKNEGKRFGMTGKSGMYGATPGMASHTGNMQNQTMNNWLQTQGLQNQLGLGLIGSQIEAGKLTGKYQQGFDNAITTGKMLTGAMGSYGGGKKFSEGIAG